MGASRPGRFRIVYGDDYAGFAENEIAYLNKADAYGNSPLVAANNYAKTDIAEILKKKGAR